MGLTNEHVGPKILAKIKIYVLTRAELLFQVCYEIPCRRINTFYYIKKIPAFLGTSNETRFKNMVKISWVHHKTPSFKTGLHPLFFSTLELCF